MNISISTNSEIIIEFKICMQDDKYMCHMSVTWKHKYLSIIHVFEIGNFYKNWKNFKSVVLFFSVVE